ncbi:cation:proton antiporter, partial [Streptomyces albiflaviniger]|nr:cation:proton antiporter [Streptomyces albiflaviniger]
LGPLTARWTEPVARRVTARLAARREPAAAVAVGSGGDGVTEEPREVVDDPDAVGRRS